MIYCQLFCLIVGRLECMKSYQKLWSMTSLPGLGRYLVMPLTRDLSYPLYCLWCTYRILTQFLLYLWSTKFLSLSIITAWISNKCSAHCPVMSVLKNSWVFSLIILNVHLQKGWYLFFVQWLSFWFSHTFKKCCSCHKSYKTSKMQKAPRESVVLWHWSACSLFRTAQHKSLASSMETWTSWSSVILSNFQQIWYSVPLHIKTVLYIIWTGVWHRVLETFWNKASRDFCESVPGKEKWRQNICS